MAGLLRTVVFSAAFFSTVVFAGFGSAGPPDSEKGAKEISPEAAARTKLSEKGVRVSRSGLSLVDEKELGRVLNEANSLKRKLVSAAKELQAAQQEIEQRQADLDARHRAHFDINSQLANLPRSNVVEHNQLVTVANANASAINLLNQEQEQSKRDVDVVRKKSNAARESFVQQLVEVRALVDRLSERYKELKGDRDAQNALAEWNSAANTSFELKPSTFFLNGVKKLEVLEKTVQTDKIPLRREGNSYYATVVINGKQTEDMVVDTGANSVVLPYKVAVECGLKLDSAVPVVAMVADGSKVDSKKVVLDSVRVGKFTADHVECVVLPPEARTGHMLLGMTFLSRFNVSINGTELVLTKLDGDQAAAKPKKKPRASKSLRKTRKSES